jgi:hypothetical protein
LPSLFYGVTALCGLVDSHDLFNLPEENIIPHTGFVRTPGSLDVRRDEKIKHNYAYCKMLERLSKRYSDFHFFYSGIYLCNPKVCRPDLKDHPLFQTRDHLTPYGSRLLIMNMKPLLDKLAGEPRAFSDQGFAKVSV